MTPAKQTDRFSPLGTPVVGFQEQLLWEVETPVFRCRMPASASIQNAVSLGDAVQDPQALPFFEMLVPRPPFQMLEAVVELFRGIIYHAGQSTEALVQLTYSNGEWHIQVPWQEASAKHVTSTAISAAHNVALEIHSHGTLPAYFSETDDEDETDGFLYGVIGDLTAWAPSQRFRVGHAGCFFDLQFEQVFDLPEGLISPQKSSRKPANE